MYFIYNKVISRWERISYLIVVSGGFEDKRKHGIIKMKSTATAGKTSKKKNTKKINESQLALNVLHLWLFYLIIIQP